MQILVQLIYISSMNENRNFECLHIENVKKIRQLFSTSPNPNMG